MRMSQIKLRKFKKFKSHHPTIKFIIVRVMASLKTWLRFDTYVISTLLSPLFLVSVRTWTLLHQPLASQFYPKHKPTHINNSAIYLKLQVTTFFTTHFLYFSYCHKLQSLSQSPGATTSCSANIGS